MCKELDKDFLKSAAQQQYADGTTCLIAYIKDCKLSIGNIGDSSAILIKDNKSFEVTSEQTPTRIDEYQRITSRQGLILPVGEQMRVGGVLSVSRAIGDMHYKDYVISEPETTSFDITVGD